MAATMHPATEVALARAVTTRRLAERLDAEWDARLSAARRLDRIVADLAAAERGDPAAVVDAVDRARCALAEVSARLAPAEVRRG